MQAAADETDARAASHSAREEEAETEAPADLSSPTSSADSNDDDSADAKGFNINGYRQQLIEQNQYFGETLTGAEDTVYDLTEGKRLAIVFNQESFDNPDLSVRKGTEEDCREIKAVFGSMGFEVKVLKDRTWFEIESRLDLLSDPDQGDVAVLALFFLTHGEEMGALHARDKMFRIEKVLAKLVPSVCPNLAGKPKLVFVAACQGSNTDDGFHVRTVRSRHTSTDSAPSGFKIPNLADFLVFQASFHGHFAFRSSAGTWFVQQLCRALRESPADEDLVSALTRAKRYVSIHKESNVPNNPELDGKKQIPVVQDTLIRKVYLKRGAQPRGEQARPVPVQGDAPVAVDDVKAFKNGTGEKKAALDRCSVA